MADKYLVPSADGVDFAQTEFVTNGGAPNAGKGVAVGSDGYLSAGLIPPDIARADAEDLIAGEAISAPAITTIAQSGGQAGKVVNASAAPGSTRRATGFITASAANGDTVNFRNSGKITGFTGLTPGAAYFLSPTNPGQITSTVPTAAATGAGTVLQYVGIAVSANTLDFEPRIPVRLS